jgi:electron transfer flavoprotein beta subunit
VLRSALANGADRAIRVDIDQQLPSAVVAAAIAGPLAECDVVVCGSWSVDRGSGSVPAFLAHELAAAQALGCVRVERRADELRAERRLDGGRREMVRLMTPAVVSVEAGAAVLRRASLPAVLAADRVAIDVVVPTVADDHRVRTVGRRPYRPRSRQLSPPSGADARGRVLSLMGTDSDRQPLLALELDPTEAADRLLDQLAGWGVQPIDRTP